LTYTVYKNIDETSAKWDSFLPDNHHLLSFQLRILEKSGLSNVNFYYLIFSNKEGETVGLAYFQDLPFQREHYNYPLSKNVFLKQLESLFTKRGFRILALGNLLRINAPGLFFDERKISSLEIFSQLEEFYKSLGSQPDSILIKDWQFEDDHHWAKQLKYSPWQADLTMKLKMNPRWKSMDDYVSSLRHRYSQRYRKMRRMLSPISRRALSEDQIRFFEKELSQLYLNVVQRQSIRLLIVTGEYFMEMKKSLGDCFIVMGYFHGEKLVAFSSNISHENQWELHYIGLDYHYNKEYSIYFNILYDAISDSIEASKQEMELGRTARNTKAIMGAEPVYFRNYVRFKNRTARLVTGFLRKFFNQFNEVDIEVSKPFK